MRYNIQALRAVAAYLVVFHHIIDAFNNYITSNDIQISLGARGVDIFFVISGYIMAETTSRGSVTPAGFLKNRIIRVAPTYWLLTLFAALLMASGFKLFGNAFSFDKLIGSLLFLSEDPIVFVGWTLNYEMFFYLIFSACLLIHSNIDLRLYAVTAAIVLLWLVGLTLGKGGSLGYLLDGIVLNFAAGMLLFKISNAFKLSGKTGLCFMAAGSFGLIANDMAGPDFAFGLINLVSASSIVFGALVMEDDGLSIGSGFAARQGDVSYSTYLTHPFVLQFTGKLFILLGVSSSMPLQSLYVITSVVLIFVFSNAFFNFAERPIQRFLRRSTGQGAPRPSYGPAG